MPVEGELKQIRCGFPGKEEGEIDRILPTASVQVRPGPGRERAEFNLEGTEAR